MTIPHFLKLLGKSAAAWNEDDCSGMGAAIAFYTLFSIAPLLVIVIGAASLIFGYDVARWQTIVQLRGLLGDPGAHAVMDLLASANSPATSTLTAVVSTVLLMFGATAVFTEVYSDFNRIWHNPSPPKATDIWYLVRTRIFSFGLLLVIGFLLLVSLAVSVGLAAAGDWWDTRFWGWPVVGQAVSIVANLATYTLAFAMIYKFVPHARIQWHEVWIGAAVTAVLFEIGKVLIGFYVASNFNQVFGAAGSLVMLLVWLYYSAQVFLLGAEFTYVYANRRGSVRS